MFAVVREDRASGDCRGRRPEHDGLRVCAVRDNVLQSGLLLGRVLLRLINDKRVITFTEAAGRCPGAELYDAAVSGV